MPRSIDRTTLESLPLGKLPPAAAEPLLRQLEDHEALARLAGKLAESPDTLVESLRAQATRIDKPPEPRIAALIDRLTRMWEAQHPPAPPDDLGTVFVQGKASQSLPFL